MKVTLYDPGNGVLTSIQTKTIRKVSHLICVGVAGCVWGLWYCLEVFFKSNSRGKVKAMGNVRIRLLSEWKEMFHGLLSFSVYGIIVVFFSAKILLKGRGKTEEYKVSTDSKLHN